MFVAPWGLPVTSRSCVACGTAAQWAALARGPQLAEVTEADLAAARERFGRLFLMHLVAVIFDLPTRSAARAAVRRGAVRLNGRVVRRGDAPAAAPGDALSLEAGVAEVPDDLEERLRKWNARSSRQEAQIRLLYSDPASGWAVVNKPAGLDSVPWAESRQRRRFTLQSYLPTVVPPPTRGTPCRGPRACHRLDYRVAGPLIVATSEEAMRRLKRSFAQQEVEKEYRAIVCGRVADREFSITESLDDRPCRTDVKVLEVVKCPHYGELSMLALWPRTGRYRQLRRHLAEVLGKPIVNEDEGLFRLGSQRCQEEGGAALALVSRGSGNLFLQAVEVAVHGVVVRQEASERFAALLRSSEAAYQRRAG